MKGKAWEALTLASEGLHVSLERLRRSEREREVEKEGLELREPRATHKRPYSKRRQSPERHATSQVLQVTLALMETPQNRFFASPKTGCEGVWRFRED